MPLKSNLSLVDRSAINIEILLLSVQVEWAIFGGLYNKKLQ